MTVHQKVNRGLDDYQPPPELLLRSAMNALPSHIAMLDEDANITGVNAAWRRFGDNNDYHDPDYGLGRNYLEICEAATGRDSEEAEQVSRGLRDILNERRSIFRIEYPCHSPNVKRWFTLQIARFEWEGDLRVIAAHQNVTDLKVAQQAFAQSQKRLQTVVDTVVDGIFTTDEKGTIESVNPAVCEIFGYQPAELVGSNIRSLMPEPYSSHYSGYIMQHRKANGKRYAEVGHEVQGRRRDGTQFPMYIAISRAYFGGRWLFTGIVQDLTPRKRIEEEKVEKERLRVALDKELELRELKNRFMSMISHELRTPLSVILVSSDFMRRYGDKMPEEEKMEAIATIQTQVRHLENMVDDVSALSRADTLDVNIRTESVDLVDLCSDIVANAQMMAKKNQRVIFDSSGYCPSMLADAKLLRQAITNLTSNAVKYSEDGTVVRLTLNCTPENIVITVADQGIGIPEKDQAKLFEPFHRASNVGTHQGTGLGLAVTRRAIELHGGKITYKSRETEGTTFTITLPAGENS